MSRSQWGSSSHVPFVMFPHKRRGDPLTHFCPRGNLYAAACNVKDNPWVSSSLHVSPDAATPAGTKDYRRCWEGHSTWPAFVSWGLAVTQHSNPMICVWWAHIFLISLLSLPSLFILFPPRLRLLVSLSVSEAFHSVKPSFFSVVCSRFLWWASLGQASRQLPIDWTVDGLGVFAGFYSEPPDSVNWAKAKAPLSLDQGTTLMLPQTVLGAGNAMKTTRR